MASMEASHCAELDFGSAFSAPSGCPDCGSPRLTARDAGDKTYFICEDCHTTWGIDMGQIVRVTTRHAVPEPR